MHLCHAHNLTFDRWWFFGRAKMQKGFQTQSYHVLRQICMRKNCNSVACGSNYPERRCICFIFWLLLCKLEHYWLVLVHTLLWCPRTVFLKYSDIMRDNCCYAKKSEPDATLKGSSVETYCSEQAIWIIHWCNFQYIMETWWQPIVSQCDCPNFWSEILWLSHYKMTNTVHNYLSVDCQYFRGAERMLTGFCLLSGFSGPSTSHRFQTVFFVPNITEVAAPRHKRITPSQQQWRQGITDHMNLGSLLRSAAFFGVEGGPKGSHEGWRGGLSHGLQC